MRLLAPALAAIRSTRAPASPCAANSSLAASRMRSRIPSGSRCHFWFRRVLLNSYNPAEALSRWPHLPRVACNAKKMNWIGHHCAPDGDSGADVAERHMIQIMSLYSTIVRPLAFRLEPETAHHLA